MFNHELQKLKDAGATLHYMSALADIGAGVVRERILREDLVSLHDWAGGR